MMKLPGVMNESDQLHFLYDATGPVAVFWNGTPYYYMRNLQGDVTAILDGNGAAVVGRRYSNPCRL